jgi:SOS-response transcriptional repressor LexA
VSMGLTVDQARCLGVIERGLAEGGVCPSYDEIAAALGLASKSGVKRLIDGLEARGRIRCLPFKPRAIEVLDPAAPPAQAARIEVEALDDAALTALGVRVAAELAARVKAGARP